MRPARWLFLLPALLVSPSALAFGVEVGLGGAAGGAFWEPDVVGADGMGFGAAGSPLLSAQLDLGDAPIRPVFGLSSAPTFQYSMGYDAFTIPLVVADLGVAVGSDTTRGTLGVHAGYLSFGSSARFTHVPWKLGPAAHTGFEVRATWLLRYGGYLGALWVVRFG